MSLKKAKVKAPPRTTSLQQNSIPTFAQRLYAVAVAMTPPILDSSSSSSNESDGDFDEEDDIRSGEEGVLLSQLNAENAALQRDPRTILFTGNNSLSIHSHTLRQLTTLPPDPAELEIWWKKFLAPISLIAPPQDDDVERLPHLFIAKTRAAPIPDPLRAAVWAKLCGADGDACFDLYQELLQFSSSTNPDSDSPTAAEKLIERDIGRTFPHSDMFREDGGEGQRKLFRVLKAYSVYDTKVEYCQGLSFCVGPLLMQKMREQDAFAVLLKLMGRVPKSDTQYHEKIPTMYCSTPGQTRKFGIRTMFTPDMTGLHLALFQHTAILQRHIPRLAAHFQACHITSTMYASQWFLTLFSYSAPIPLVNRIFDLIFAEGALLILMRLSISLLARNESLLLTQPDLESLMAHLKGSSLLVTYGGEWESVIRDATSLAHTISFSVLEELEARFFKQQAVREDLETLTNQISYLHVTLRERETHIKKLSVSNSLFEAESRRLQEQLEVAVGERKELEKEAEELRSMVEGDSLGRVPSPNGTFSR